MNIETIATAYCASCGDEMTLEAFISSTYSCCATCEHIQMEAKEILQIKRQIIPGPATLRSTAVVAPRQLQSA